MVHSPRRSFLRAALAAALAASIAAPAAGSAVRSPGVVPPTAVQRAGSGDARSLRNLPTSLLVTLRPGVGPEAADAAAAARGLVRVAWNPDLRTAQYVAADVAAARTGAAEAIALAEAIDRAAVVDRRSVARLATFGAELGRLAGVVAAQPPIRLDVLDGPVLEPATAVVPTGPVAAVAPTGPVAAPNDPLWTQQWGPEAIGARSAWQLTRGRPEIVVAVIDTGVDLGHLDLAGKLMAGTDLGDGDSDPSDEYGHGTHVAGIVAAASGNGRGVSGAAPGVLVMPIKVSSFDRTGALDIADLTVAQAIVWAADRGARVVNLSLGAPHDLPSSVIEAAIDNVRARGVVVVAAAGNDGPGGGVRQPGAYGPTVAVAALEDRDPESDGDGNGWFDGCGEPRYGPGDFRVAPYSGAGPEVDLAGPGTCILSTYPAEFGSSYSYLDGTSMAAPFVSAAAALVLSRNPSLGAPEVEAALISTARDFGVPGPDAETGAGLLDSAAAVASIVAPAPDGANPAVRLSGIADGMLVRGTVTITASVTDASPIVATRLARDGRLLYLRRSSGVAVGWASATIPDGLHTWTAYGTDAGLRVGTASARVLVANRRPVTRISTSTRMTARSRSILRSVRIAKRAPFVARFTGPAGSRVVMTVTNATGRVVALGRGSGSAAVALTSLAAGRYTIRAAVASARPGLRLRLVAAWLR